MNRLDSYSEEELLSLIDSDLQDEAEELHYIKPEEKLVIPTVPESNLVEAIEIHNIINIPEKAVV